MATLPRGAMIMVDTTIAPQRAVSSSQTGVPMRNAFTRTSLRKTPRPLPGSRSCGAQRGQQHPGKIMYIPYCLPAHHRHGVHVSHGGDGYDEAAGKVYIIYFLFQLHTLPHGAEHGCGYGGGHGAQHGGKLGLYMAAQVIPYGRNYAVGAYIGNSQSVQYLRRL